MPSLPLHHSGMVGANLDTTVLTDDNRHQNMWRLPADSSSPNKAKRKGKAGSSSGGRSTFAGYLSMEASMQLLQSFGAALQPLNPPIQSAGEDPASSDAAPPDASTSASTSALAEAAGYLCTLTRSILKATRNPKAKPSSGKGGGVAPGMAGQAAALHAEPAEPAVAAEGRRAALAQALAREALQLYQFSEKVHRESAAEPADVSKRQWSG